MKVEPVSELDARWEQHANSFRIYFWTKLSESKEPGTAPHWSSNCRRVSGVEEIREVLAWAEETAAGRPFTVYVEVATDVPGSWGLVRIGGVDPTFD